MCLLHIWERGLKGSSSRKMERSFRQDCRIIDNKNDSNKRTWSQSLTWQTKETQKDSVCTSDSWHCYVSIHKWKSLLTEPIIHSRWTSSQPTTHTHTRLAVCSLQRSRLRDQRRKIQQQRKQWRGRGWEKRELGWLSLCSNLYATYLATSFYFASTASKLRGLRKWRGENDLPAPSSVTFGNGKRLDDSHFLSYLPRNRMRNGIKSSSLCATVRSVSEQKMPVSLLHDRPLAASHAGHVSSAVMASTSPEALVSIREVIGICKQKSFLKSNNSDVSPGTGFELCQATPTPKETEIRDFCITFCPTHSDMLPPLPHAVHGNQVLIFHFKLSPSMFS